MNWIRFGHATKLADAGFEAIMLDLRAHGASDAPHDPEAYPADVLVKDLQAMWEALWRPGMHLVGFSLGARTAVGAVMAGVEPRKLVLAGMGYESLCNWNQRVGFFVDAIDRFEQIKRDDPAFFAVQFMKTMKIDREAARLLLGRRRTIVDLGMRHVAADFDLGHRDAADARVLDLELQQIGEFTPDLLGNALTTGKFLGHDQKPATAFSPLQRLQTPRASHPLRRRCNS